MKQRLKFRQDGKEKRKEENINRKRNWMMSKMKQQLKSSQDGKEKKKEESMNQEKHLIKKKIKKEEGKGQKLRLLEKN